MALNHWWLNGIAVFRDNVWIPGTEGSSSKGWFLPYMASQDHLIDHHMMMEMDFCWSDVTVIVTLCSSCIILNNCILLKALQ